MGYTKLTRYNLYYDAYLFFNEAEQRSNFDFVGDKDVFSLFTEDGVRALRDMYKTSYLLLSKVEGDIHEINQFTLPNFQEKIDKNIQAISDKSLAETFITHNITNNPKVKTYREALAQYLEAIASFQNEIVEKCIKKEKGNGDSFFKEQKKNTFLSYAIDDKGLALAMFVYFWKNNGFLYVDWMWNGDLGSGGPIKHTINEALDKCSQLLFLRTVNSEFRLKGNKILKPWCAWEIGNFYTKHPGKKFFANFYDDATKGDSRNKILDTFSAMNYVDNGVIQ